MESIFIWLCIVVYPFINLLFNRPELALNLHLKSLEIRLRVFGEIHPDVAKSYGNIGIVYHQLGKYILFDYELYFFIRCLIISTGMKKLLKTTTKTFKLHWKCLEKCTLMLPLHIIILEWFTRILESIFYLIVHVCLIFSWNNYLIGITMPWNTTTNHLKFNWKCLERYTLILLGRTIIWEMFTRILESMLDLIIYEYQFINLLLISHDKALEYYHKSLRIKLKVFGEIHPDIAGSYNNMGNIYKNIGKYFLYYYHILFSP